MTTTTRAEALQTIRKLWARATADDSPEAAVARRKARDLMARWGITFAMLREDQQPSRPAEEARKRRASTAAESPSSIPIRLELRIGRARIRWRL